MQKEKLVPAIRFKGFKEEWKISRLCETALKFDNLRVPVAESLRIKGVFPYYGANGVQDYVSGFTHNGEFVLIAEDGANDLDSYPSNYVNGKFWANNHVHVLQGIKGTIDNKFLNYLFKNIDFKPILTGGDRAKLTASALDTINIKAPIFNEQRKIGLLLNNIDQLLLSQKSKLENLQTIKQSLLDKMFALYDQKVPEIRFKGFDESWKLNKFSDLYNCSNEKNINIRYTEKNIISVANMYFKDEQKISNAEYLKSYNIFHLGDIAYEGNKSANYRYGRFVVNTIGPGIVSHVFEVFKPVMKEYDLYFWKYYINSESIMRNVLRDSTKSATMMATLVKKDLSNQFIKITSIAEQQKIGQFFSSLDSLIHSQEQKLEKLNNIKQALLEKMFC
ncbi:restriction endonuclease subunit S [Mycoplasma sp. BRA290]|uniref:restriction endonuclease subunit S n=1 Tax=Mycoplasma sp. BRA290 TaxID=3401675 RepID=UPI003AADFD3D